MRRAKSHVGIVGAGPDFNWSSQRKLEVKATEKKEDLTATTKDDPKSPDFNWSKEKGEKPVVKASKSACDAVAVEDSKKEANRGDALAFDWTSVRSNNKSVPVVENAGPKEDISFDWSSRRFQPISTELAVRVEDRSKNDKRTASFSSKGSESQSPTSVCAEIEPTGCCKVNRAVPRIGHNEGKEAAKRPILRRSMSEGNCGVYGTTKGLNVGATILKRSFSYSCLLDHEISNRVGDLAAFEL